MENAIKTLQHYKLMSVYMRIFLVLFPMVVNLYVYLFFCQKKLKLHFQQHSLILIYHRLLYLRKIQDDGSNIGQKENL